MGLNPQEKNRLLGEIRKLERALVLLAQTPAYNLTAAFNEEANEAFVRALPQRLRLQRRILVFRRRLNALPEYDAPSLAA